MPLNRRRFVRLALLLALIGGVVGHWWFWYHARRHLLAPADSTLLAAAPALPIRLWVPYPHQNLGALGGAVAEPKAVLEAASRLAGLPPPRLPRLAPFGLPPAREMLLASSEDGERFAAAVRMYPGPALLVRLSGTLASNPWLKGGEVEVGGRPGRVRWEGLTWHLESTAAGEASPPADRAGSAVDGERPLLALLEVAAGRPPLPAGRYELAPEEGDLVFRLGPAGPPPAADPLAAAGDLGVLLLVRRGTAGEAGAREEATLVLDRDGGLLGGLPAAAAWARPNGAVKLLPAGQILASLGDLPVDPLGGGELAATDGETRRRAAALATSWLPLASGTSQPPISFGAWVDVARAARRARQVEEVLGKVPLLGEAEAGRWGDVAVLLEAAQGYERLSCWLAGDGSRGELRLKR